MCLWGREKEREERKKESCRNVYVYMCVCLTKKKVFYVSREEFIKKGLKSFFILILYSNIYNFLSKYSCKGCKDDNIPLYLLMHIYILINVLIDNFHPSIYIYIEYKQHRHHHHEQAAYPTRPPIESG